MGSEPFFIDQIANELATVVIEESAKDFDYTVLYGKEAQPDQIVEIAKRYPMMGTKQLIIIREAQHLGSSIDSLTPYFESPQEHTILVLCYKYKKLDKRKKSYKTIDKKGVIVDTKPLYESQAIDWIKARGLHYGFNFHPQSLPLLVSFLGTDLSKIDKELEKLSNRVEEGKEITPKEIEEHIGYSKDFNVFELQKSLGKRDLVRSLLIIQYMTSNNKKHPIILTISGLFNFFQKLLLFHGLTSSSNVATILGINPYFIKDYQAAARFYSMKQTAQIIGYIKEADLKSKGVGSKNISEVELLKELIIKILAN